MGNGRVADEGEGGEKRLCKFELENREKLAVITIKHEAMSEKAEIKREVYKDV